MQINGLQKLSLSDYDKKLSCVIFTPGCNFKCHFCHNSPLVIQPQNNPIIDPSDIINFLQTKKGKLDAVVISGGEPTLQGNSLKEFIIEVRKLGFLIKLDTNGTNPFLLKELIDEGLLDYVAMDIKSDWEHFQEITNTSNTVYKDLIEKSIKILINGNVDYEFRTTIVKEIHDEKCIRNISKIIKGAKKYFLQRYIQSEGVINKIYSEVPISEVKKFMEILKPDFPLIDSRSY